MITAAGVWTCLLIVWRMFDKQGATTHGAAATTSGIEWGIFVALAAAAFLAYSGSRIRAAHRPEPPLPGEDQAPAGSSAAATAVLRPRREPDAPERPRRRARPPMPGPVPADPPAADRPATERPRRRARPSELFERVVPEDPPTMRLSRIKPTTIDAKNLMAKPPAPMRTRPSRWATTPPWSWARTPRWSWARTPRCGWTTVTDRAWRAARARRMDPRMHPLQPPGRELSQGGAYI